jgi:hypothetical protein
MVFKIGDYVRRVYETRNMDGQWHLVESIIVDAAVTRCGKRLEPKTQRPSHLEVSVVQPLTRMIGQPQNCKTCA